MSKEMYIIGIVAVGTKTGAEAMITIGAINSKMSMVLQILVKEQRSDTRNPDRDLYSII